ncbi:hypothetical protein IQ62_05540 [Streptomyces scabiei]|uniref:hypothetical protein n=1 Tax=Streptomyces scabiei TaxID=1930 RepID=UPI0004E73891|nr:hypothetical protein [Streptomyces scabiei]KFG01613.1 hypothetical protein IQ62_05540 [Streptomyces scabiei]
MATNRPVKRTPSAPTGEHSPDGQAEPARHSEAAEPIRWLNEEELHARMALVGMVTKLPAAMDRRLQRDRSRDAVPTPTATLNTTQTWTEGWPSAHRE